ncbi:MAG: threonine dehydratase [Verrucomicrobiales bacterium]|nr:threonine dehydratase [Verrucomicrobiales bacterium]
MMNNSWPVTASDLAAAAKVIHGTLPTTSAALPWPLLSERSGCEVWVKHENHLPTGAFKVRGGLVYIDWLTKTHPKVKGVIAATRGNHGQSIAFAAAAKGIHATVVVPQGNSIEKNRAMIAYGATLIEHGHDFSEAFDHAQKLALETNLHFIPSFDWKLVHGVGTAGLEFLRAVRNLDTLYLPIGLGSGICGMIAARKALGLENQTEIVGVVAQQANAYAQSFAAGQPVETSSAHTIADGVSCRIPDARAVEVINAHVSRIVEVSENDIKSAMRHYFTDTHQVAEGAAALPLAALIKEKAQVAGKRIGLILTGGNVDAKIYREILQRPL